MITESQMMTGNQVMAGNQMVTRNQMITGSQMMTGRQIINQKGERTMAQENIKGMVNQPFLLEGARNVRELGGSWNKLGQILAEKKLLRGDSLHLLSEQDREQLYGYGIRYIIDLRTEDEVGKDPGKMEDCGDVKVYHISMAGNVNPNRPSMGKLTNMAQMYIYFLEECKGQIRQVMEVIARAGKGGILFHCTAGKDRTGIIAMLLLLLCDVEDPIIVRDYSTSEKNLGDLFDGQRKTMELAGVEIPDFVYTSRPEDMEETIGYLRSRYRDALGYLSSIGMLPEDIERLRKRMLGGKEDERNQD